MSVKTLLPLTLIVFALAACQPLPAVPSAIAMPEPAAIAPAATSEPASGDALTLKVEAAEVVVGVGSPIPVDIVITGTLPDTCAQIGSIDQMVEGFDFSIDFSREAVGGFPLAGDFFAALRHTRHNLLLH
jgi:hypothetical protein